MKNDAGLLVEPVLLILVSLADEPKHGYSIMQDVEALTGWTMRAGTLYGVLTRLDRLGWIEESKTDDYRRRPYSLTDAGHTELARQLSVLSNLTRAGLRRTKSHGVTKRRA
ncbi:MAG TPA: PadR family transcriptional regulator [Candidatus Eremiobacteraceae bacterium]